MQSNLYQFFIITFCLGLFACSSTKVTPSSPNYKRKTSLPKMQAKQLPGGNNDNWRYLGPSQDHNILTEINESSIMQQNGQTKFQDRKTIVDTTKFNYQGLTPTYKYSLSWWLLDCNKKQFLMSSTAIYDKLGNLLKSYNFKFNDNWTSINRDTIAMQQYDYVCNGVKRNLGY